jgi:hypothetical protein
MNKIFKFSVAFFVITIVLTSCAPGSMEYVEKSAGFLDGLWHGFISVVTLIISFFSSNYTMYETNNVGWWYDLGFVLGTAFAFSNVWFTSSRAKKKNN